MVPGRASRRPHRRVGGHTGRAATGSDGGIRTLRADRAALASFPSAPCIQPRGRRPLVRGDAQGARLAPGHSHPAHDRRGDLHERHGPRAVRRGDAAAAVAAMACGPRHAHRCAHGRDRARDQSAAGGDPQQCAGRAALSRPRGRLAGGGPRDPRGRRARRQAGGGDHPDHTRPRAERRDRTRADRPRRDDPPAPPAARNRARAPGDSHRDPIRARVPGRGGQGADRAGRAQPDPQRCRRDAGMPAGGPPPAPVRLPQQRGLRRRRGVRFGTRDRGRAPRRRLRAVLDGAQ